MTLTDAVQFLQIRDPNVIYSQGAPTKDLYMIYIYRQGAPTDKRPLQARAPTLYTTKGPHTGMQRALKDKSQCKQGLIQKVTLTDKGPLQSRGPYIQGPPTDKGHYSQGPLHTRGLYR